MKSLPCLLVVFAGLALQAAGVTATSSLPAAQGWIGPFKRPANAQPVIRPNPTSVFACPLRKQPVHWESNHTFNPAAVVRDGKIYVLYRAEDNLGKHYAGYTSRLGLAWSVDGVHFTRHPEPVLYPNNDDQKEREWEGGCEDPRVVELEDGSYAVFYTQYSRQISPNEYGVSVGIARSTDLFHWKKQGRLEAKTQGGGIFRPRKSCSLVCRVQDGRLIAAKINGRYWLYNGEHTISLMSSPDLKEWQTEASDLLRERPGHFDSGFPECGPPAVLTSKGIVLLYNAKNATDTSRDPKLSPAMYSAGQALFSAEAPAKLLKLADEPFLKPELPWESTGQYQAGTTFIEGLVLFKNRWFLYYGSADNFVGVAIADAKLQ